MRATALALLTVVQLVAAIGDTLPRLKLTPLNGMEVIIPGNPKVDAYVLTFGFSRNSDKAFRAWDKLIAPVFASAPRVAYYEIPVLQGLPGLVKPFVLRAMRGDIPKPEQSRFAPTYAEESALKNIVGFKEADAAYVVVADRSGKTVWISHAPASDVEFQSLRDAVTAVLRSRL